MSKIAFIFPGQGAQYIGMGKEFYDNYEECKEIFDKATEILGLDIKKLCFEENDMLNITKYTQMAMVTTSIAILKVVENMGIKPDVTAGLSLGEYSALAASGAMSFEDAVTVVKHRGAFMQEAVPEGLGTMYAILGADQSLVEEICKNTEGIAEVANYNCPGQIVISGEKQAVTNAANKLLESGAKKAIELNVSGPFHSSMLKEAASKLERVLNDITLNDTFIPYICNVTGKKITKTDDIKDLLVRQVYSSVLWQQTVEEMINDGVDTFIEIGPSKTLSAFVKKIDRTKNVINIEVPKDLEKLKLIGGII